MGYLGISNMAKIDGGYIVIARKILDSEIMEKPPLYSKLWLWMLNKAKFMDNDNNLKRGQFKTSINEMREAMSWKVGYRKVVPSSKEIRNPYEWLMKGTMIDITKVTGGMVITILNYDKYQNQKNYEGHSEGHSERTAKGETGAHLIIEKECKNGIKEPSAPAEELQEVYKTKKGRSLSGKRLVSFNQFWDSFNYKKGKAEAADVWLNIPTLTDSLVNKICTAAKIENDNREELKAQGRTPKMAEGWLSGRRWEDEVGQKSGMTETTEQIEKRFGLA